MASKKAVINAALPFFLVLANNWDWSRKFLTGGTGILVLSAADKLLSDALIEHAPKTLEVTRIPSGGISMVLPTKRAPVALLRTVDSLKKQLE